MTTQSQTFASLLAVVYYRKYIIMASM